MVIGKSYAFGRLDRCLKVSLLEEHVGEPISLEERSSESISERNCLSGESTNIELNPFRYLEIGIVAGVPVSINGQSLSPASLLAELNEIGWKHGIGRIDMVQNRLVGMKSRGVYKTPGGTLMAAAVRELEALTLDRETTQWKDMVALTYAELVYAGRWFDPLRQSLETIAATTTSSVTLKLYRGSASVASRKSPFSLYREDNQTDADGFIRLYVGGGHLSSLLTCLLCLIQK
ncbi:argininosuccinate synthase, chloroplastic-like [Miscanthus floridulus]|uniref:argininosuccinate synthase, chloroplastic-like n=1 Tax=Miscanthus floridulus TaxID=154761 RepID=UPI003459F93D